MQYHAISELVTKIAQKTGAPEAQVRAFLQAQAEAAYELASGGCPLPGIGVMHTFERPEGKLAVAGRQAALPAKRILKFRLSGLAKDVVLLAAPVPDVLETELFPPGEELAD